MRTTERNVQVNSGVIHRRQYSGIKRKRSEATDTHGFAQIFFGSIGVDLCSSVACLSLFGFYALCIICVFVLSALADVRFTILCTNVNGTLVDVTEKHTRALDYSGRALNIFID